MKQSNVVAYQADARAILDRIGATLGQDYHTLSSDQVDRVVTEADIRRYRAPRNANGSRARYFYALVQRRAQD